MKNALLNDVTIVEVYPYCSPVRVMTYNDAGDMRTYTGTLSASQLASILYLNPDIFMFTPVGIPSRITPIQLQSFTR